MLDEDNLRETPEQGGGTNAFIDDGTSHGEGFYTYLAH